MEDSIFLYSLLAAMGLTGLLCGASLDQSIKQLPSRHVIGTRAFSSYAKAADLRNGIAWYAGLGIGSFLLTLMTAIMALIFHRGEDVTMPVYLAAIFTFCHSICTIMAAPVYHKQKLTDDREVLRKLFNKFEKVQTVRSAFITLAFLSFLWTVILLV